MYGVRTMYVTVGVFVLCHYHDNNRMKHDKQRDFISVARQF